MDIIYNYVSPIEYNTRIFTEIINMLHWFAGKQIRNVAVSMSNECFFLLYCDCYL